MNALSRTRRRSAIGAAVVASTVLALLAWAPLPANAATNTLDPALQITGSTVKLTPSSRTGVVEGTSALRWGPAQIETDQSCPAGYRSSSRTFVIAPGGTVSQAATARTNQSAIYWGLRGEPGDVIWLDNVYASNWSGFTPGSLTTGLNKLVITCDPDQRAEDAPFSDSKYFLVTLQVDVAAESWTVVDNPSNPVTKTTPTVAFSGSTANANGTATLIATVSGASGTATDASGKVAFSGTHAGLASPVTGEVQLANGVASWTTPVLDAGQSYTFTAGYRANGDTKYTDSAADATTTVTTVAEPQAPQNTDITVTIPASATGLKFTITPGNVALTGTTLQGTSYVATGTLGDVKVSDNRDTRTAWTLNGKAGAFANTADASKTIAASHLGWKPALVGTGAGTAGTEVVAGEGGGLSTDKPLAQTAAGATVADTTVKAGITLKAPADSAAGDYKATLTLTLI
ncbi:hypothetical protein [Luethyella okanaganae]|uniref:Bacterial Ig-like domain-containing protein n=1 Tax=Luethyella okanaganae TaxID=69372 RepID=A0ABW1VKL8_9MICO